MRTQGTYSVDPRQAIIEELLAKAIETRDLALRFVPPHERPAWRARARRELADILRRSRRSRD